MKRLVIAALAIGAMAACTKSNIQYEQPEEISFQPVAKKATKAVNGAIDGNDYPTGEDFNVWSWWTGEPAGTSISELAKKFEFNEANTESDKPILYINAGTFANRKDADSKPTNTWGGKTTPYYWPTTGSLVFAGYSPAPAEASRGTFKYDFDTQTFTVEGYTQSNDISKTVDLMWFDADQSYKKKDAVSVTFNHALSWLEFKFKLADDDTPHNWKITKVTLNGIETKADFSSSPMGWSNYSTEDAYKNQQMTIFTGNKSLESSEAGYLSADADARKNENTGVVVIPQSCAPAIGNDAAAAELVIEYGLLTPASVGTESEVYIPQRVTLPLTYTAEGGSTPEYAWEPGYHYIYTITFGANEILISPSVTDWTDETENIDVV